MNLAEYILSLSQRELNALVAGMLMAGKKGSDDLAQRFVNYQGEK